MDKIKRLSRNETLKLIGDIRYPGNFVYEEGEKLPLKNSEKQCN